MKRIAIYLMFVLITTISLASHFEKISSWGSGPYVDVLVNNHLIYAAASNGGIDVLDVSNLQDPLKIASLTLPGSAVALGLYGDYLYVATQGSGIQIVDVLDPFNPHIVNSYLMENVNDVAIEGQRMYVSKDDGFAILSLSEPTSPALLGEKTGCSAGSGIFVSGSIVYLADGTSGLRIFDCTVPGTPLSAGSATVAGGAVDVLVADGLAYVTCDDVASGTLEIFDVSTPGIATPVGNCSVTGHPNGLQLIDSFVFIADSTGHVRQVDISDPSKPSVVSSYQTTYGSPKGIEVCYGRLVVAAGTQGLLILNRVVPFGMDIYGGFNESGEAMGACRVNNTVYLAHGNSGLRIIDISDLDHPLTLGGLSNIGDCLDVAVTGNVACVATDVGMRTIDVTDPSNPVALGEFVANKVCEGVEARDSIAYLASGSNGMLVLDVSTPASPSLVTGFNSGVGSVTDVMLLGNYAYLCKSSYGIQIVDISVPSSPSLVGSAGGGSINPRAVSACSSLVAVADGASGFSTYDSSTPASPSHEATMAMTGDVEGIWISPTRALVGVEGQGIVEMNVTNPSSPTYVRTTETAGTPLQIRGDASLLLVSSGESGRLIFGKLKDEFVISGSTTHGGSISTGPEQFVSEGSSVTVKIVPDLHFQIQDVLIDGTSVGPVKEYTFENINDNHTVHAIFQELDTHAAIPRILTGSVRTDLVLMNACSDQRRVTVIVRNSDGSQLSRSVHQVEPKQYTTIPLNAGAWADLAYQGTGLTQYARYTVTGTDLFEDVEIQSRNKGKEIYCLFPHESFASSISAVNLAVTNTEPHSVAVNASAYGADGTLLETVPLALNRFESYYDDVSHLFSVDWTTIARVNLVGSGKVVACVLSNWNDGGIQCLNGISEPLFSGEKTLFVPYIPSFSSGLWPTTFVLDNVGDTEESATFILFEIDGDAFAQKVVVPAHSSIVQPISGWSPHALNFDTQFGDEQLWGRATLSSNQLIIRQFSTDGNQQFTVILDDLKAATAAMYFPLHLLDNSWWFGFGLANITTESKEFMGTVYQGGVEVGTQSLGTVNGHNMMVRLALNPGSDLWNSLQLSDSAMIKVWPTGPTDGTSPTMTGLPMCGNGTRMLAPSGFEPACSLTHREYRSDLTYDAHSDILWTNTSTGDTSVWTMGDSGKTGSINPGTLETGWSVFGPGDFNGDGYADILLTNSSTGEMAIWFMGASGFDHELNIGTADLANFTLYGPCDFNGDGTADLLWRHNTTGQMYFWFMDGTGQIGSQYIGTVDDFNYQIFGPADFNGDGIGDIYWRNSVNGVMFIWYMSATGTDHSVYLGTVSDPNWVIETYGDFNGDGNFGILWRDHSTGAMSAWHFDNSGYTGSTYIGTIDDMNWQIFGPGDFNGDGSYDIIWRNSANGVLFNWYFNATGYQGSSYIGTVADPNWVIKNR